jgi:hypothetical protein
MHAYIFGLTYGILALLAFGYLLTWLPKKYSLLATSSSTLLIWPLVIIAALILLLTAPAKGRVISP